MGKALRLAAGLAAVVMIAATGAAAQLAVGGPRNEIVLTDKDAVAVLPPELIATPVVEEIDPSPTGRFLLVRRASVHLSAEALHRAEQDHRPPDGETALVLWDSRTRTGREVWHGPTPADSIRQIAWLPQTDVALVVVDEAAQPEPGAKPDPALRRHGLLRVTPGSERAQVLWTSRAGDYGGAEIVVSQSLPAAILHHYGFRTEPNSPWDTLQLIDTAGRLGAVAAIPDPWQLGGVRWLRDGRASVTLMALHSAGNPQAKWAVMDPRDGSLEPLERDPSQTGELAPAPVPVPVNTGGLAVKSGTMQAKEGDTMQPVGLLWLEFTGKSARPRALIAADAPQGGTLLGAADVIVYRAQGAAWAAPLMRLTLAEYQRIKVAAERTVTISNAKQVGLGLLMYAADNNDMLPAGDPASLILPYLSNNGSLLSGFTYTYGGGALANIPTAETEIGYVNGPGGRAIIFADGHVTWKGN